MMATFRWPLVPHAVLLFYVVQNISDLNVCVYFTDLSHEEHMSIGDTEDMTDTGSVHSEDEQTLTGDRDSATIQVINP